MKFLSIVIVTIFILLSSCGIKVYNLDIVNQTHIKDTQEHKLYVRIVNVGKTGISSLGIYTECGLFTFRGILSGDTIPYIPIYSFYDNPGYRISVVSDRFIGKLQTSSIDAHAIDHVGDEKFTSGYYTIKVSVELKNRRIKHHNLKVVNDKTTANFGLQLAGSMEVN